MAFENDGAVIIDVTADTEDFNKSLKAAGNMAKTAGAAIGAALAGASAALLKISDESIKAYANYEQLIGGVETLFGAGGQTLEEYAASIGTTVDKAAEEYNRMITAQDAVMKYASEAYKTAGLSANNYMETVTGFSAALISSLEGDTQAAAEVANMAIIDMADNANKMGTNIQSIQNAYQGFAKQNYTMLDNLKLGYGGTKTEMERLLADAEKLTGIHYNIDNYADVVNAIHAIQNEIGITGTTQKEAATTIQGSISTMKAAWENALTGMADDTQDFNALVSNLTSSILTVADNVLPRIEQVLPNMASGVNQLTNSLLTRIPETLNNVLPEVLDGAEQLVSSLLDVLSSAATTGGPIIGESAKNIIHTLVSGIKDNLPELITAAFDMIVTIAEGILDPQTVAELEQAAFDVIVAFGDALTNNLPELIPTATQAILTLAQNLLTADNIAKIAETGMSITEALIDGILNAVLSPEFADKFPEIIIAIGDGLIRSVGEIGTAAVRIADEMADRLVNFDWSDMANVVMSHIAEALNNARKGVQVVLDNIFSGGELYGGDVNNVEDYNPAIEAYKRGAAEIVGAMGTAQESIQTAYNNGKAELDAMFGKDDTSSKWEQSAAEKREAAQAILDKYRDQAAEWKRQQAENADSAVNGISNGIINTLTARAGAVKTLTDEEAKALHNLAELDKESGTISEAAYYDRIQDIVNQLDTSSDLYDKYNLEVVKGRKKLSEALEKENAAITKKLNAAAVSAAKSELSDLNKALKGISDNYKSSFNEIIKERDKYKDKLLNDGIFSVVTSTDAETGENITTYEIDNIKKIVAARKEYIKQMQALRQRGIASGLLDELESMDADKAVVFAKQLNKMSEADFKALNSSYNELDKLASDAADERYSGQIDELRTGFIDEVRTLFKGLSGDISAAGETAINDYITSLDNVDITKPKAFDEIEKYADNIGKDITKALENNTIDLSDRISDILKDSDSGNALVDNIISSIYDRSGDVQKAIQDIIDKSNVDFAIHSDMLNSAYTMSSPGRAAAAAVVSSNATNTASQQTIGTNQQLTINANLQLTERGKGIIAEIVDDYNKTIQIVSGS